VQKYNIFFEIWGSAVEKNVGKEHFSCFVASEKEKELPFVFIKG
jgi:hypothetical protein